MSQVGTVNVLHNDALCTDNREVTTYVSETVFLHWNFALGNSNDARCNDSQTCNVSLRLSLRLDSTIAVTGGVSAARQLSFTFDVCVECCSPEIQYRGAKHENL